MAYPSNQNLYPTGSPNTQSNGNQSSPVLSYGGTNYVVSASVVPIVGDQFSLGALGSYYQNVFGRQFLGTSSFANTASCVWNTGSTFLSLNTPNHVFGRKKATVTTASYSDVYSVFFDQSQNASVVLSVQGRLTNSGSVSYVGEFNLIKDNSVESGQPGQILQERNSGDANLYAQLFDTGPSPSTGSVNIQMILDGAVNPVSDLTVVYEVKGNWRALDVTSSVYIPPLPDPTTDPSLYAWYSSDYGVTTGSDGNVKASQPSVWLDRSGYSHHLDSDVAPPEYWTGSKALTNGKPVIAFNSSPIWGFGETVQQSTASNIQQPFAIFALVYAPNYGAYLNESAFWSNINRAYDATLIQYNGVSNDVTQYADTTLTTNISTAPTINMPTGSWHVVTAIYSGSLSTMNIDGGSDVTGNTGTGSNNIQLQFGHGGSHATVTPRFAAMIVTTGSIPNSTTRAIHTNWLRNYGGL